MKKYFRVLFTVIGVWALLSFSALGQSLEEFKKLDAKFGKMHLSEIEGLAKSGNVDAQGLLGIYYSNGIRVPQNKRLAEKWYILAAKQGHEDAQYNLGQMYRNGDLGAPDYKSALYWYEEAAKNKVASAASNTAGMYYEGKGVPPSELMATKWMFIASYLGDDIALRNLSILKGSLSASDFKKAEQLARSWIKANGL